jgi:hypothetical protein
VRGQTPGADLLLRRPAAGEIQCPRRSGGPEGSPSGTRDARASCLDGDRTSAFQQAVQHLRQLLLGLQTNQSLCGAIVTLEEEDLRDRIDSVASCQIGIIKDVYLANLDSPCILLRDAIDDRR